MFGPCSTKVSFLVLHSLAEEERACSFLCSCCHVAVNVLCLFLMVAWVDL